MKTIKTDRLAAALEVLPAGLIICDPNGQLRWANAKARQWLSLPASEALSTYRLQVLLPGLSWPPGPEVCHVRGSTGQLLAVQAWPLEASGGLLVQLQRVSTQAAWQPLVLQQLLEGLRRPVANIRAAIETLAAYPDMAPELAAQFRQILLEQVEALTRLLEQTVATYTHYLRTHWPLERMPIAELLQIMAAALTQDSRSVLVEKPDQVCTVRADRQLWRQFWELLGNRLRSFVRKGKGFKLVAAVREGLVWIDVQWQGRRLPPERLQQWLTQTLSLSEQSLSLTLAEVLAWHEADLWIQEGDNAGPRLRLVLPESL